MKPEEILRIVDAIHRDKNIDKEIVFQAIEAALVTALSRQFGETSVVTIEIDRENGKPGRDARRPAEIDTAELSGRIGAQTAKQVIIQKIREAERDAIHDEFEEQVGQMMSGVVTRFEGATATVQVGTHGGDPAAERADSQASRTTPTSGSGARSSRSARSAAG
jgi:transcription termination/antitermination protein NusA